MDRNDVASVLVGLMKDSPAGWADYASTPAHRLGRSRIAARPRLDGHRRLLQRFARLIKNGESNPRTMVVRRPARRWSEPRELSHENRSDRWDGTHRVQARGAA